MQNLSPVVTLTATSATVAGSVTKGVSLIGGTRHFVAIEPGLLAGLFALPAQVTAWKETSFTWITPATGEAQLLSLNPTSATPAPSNVPARDAVLAIDRPIAVTIWYDPSTLVPDEIAAPSQNAVLTRERP